MSIQIDLAGRTAAVTGGAGGIGRAVSDGLLASGAEVIVWDRPDGRPSDLPSAAAYVCVDVADEASVQRAYDATIAQAGKVDILVNSAGVTGTSAPTESYALSDWLNVLAVNLTGTFLTSRCVIAAMRSRNWGRIVNISSVAGKESNPWAPAYTASKAGVIGLTKTMGQELATSGILVNAVAPGIIETAFLDGLSEAAVEHSRNKVPMKRMGQPAEVAALVIWLCSEQCSFSTGAIYDISGGRATY